MGFNKHPTNSKLDYRSEYECGVCHKMFDESIDLDKHVENTHRKPIPPIIAPIEPGCAHNPVPNFKGLMSMNKEKAVAIFIDICDKCNKELTKEYEVHYSSKQGGELF